MDIFAPIIGLHSQDITVLALLAEFGGYGVVVIYLFEGRIASDGIGLGDGVALVMVEIQAMASGSHEDVVVFLRRHDAPFFAAPAHHDGRGVEVSAFEDFIPSDDGFAF